MYSRYHRQHRSFLSGRAESTSAADKSQEILPPQNLRNAPQGHDNENLNKVQCYLSSQKSKLEPELLGLNVTEPISSQTVKLVLCLALPWDTKHISSNLTLIRFRYHQGVCWILMGGGRWRAALPPFPLTLHYTTWSTITTRVMTHILWSCFLAWFVAYIV